MARRIVSQPPAGIPKKSAAPFWRGERCEDAVRRRLSEREAQRPAARRSKRERTPHQRLRRLERALLRRKTLAGRQRVKLQIKQLKRELDLT